MEIFVLNMHSASYCLAELPRSKGLMSFSPLNWQHANKNVCLVVMWKFGKMSDMMREAIMN